MSRTRIEGDDDHTQITSGLCSLIGRVKIDGQRLKGLYEPSVKKGLADAALFAGGGIVSV